jgi:hypothetical protein
MPIQLEPPIRALPEQEFHDLDVQIMRLAFDLQNDLGRFYDEKIDQEELLRACLINGIQANAKIKIHNSCWGAFLNTALYKEASCHFLGGQENIIQPVRITTGGTERGTQRIPLLPEKQYSGLS